MIYQPSSNLQIKKLLKNSLHRIKIELRDTTGEKKIILCPKELTEVFSCFARFRIIILNYTLFEMVVQNSVKFPIFRGHARQRGRDLVILNKLLGELQFPL